MKDHKNEKIIMGMRNMQIYHTPEVAKMYFDYNSKIKFILSLRNPIHRTVTISSLVKKTGNFGSDQVIFDINKEIHKNQPYMKRSYIYSMLKEYLNFFPKKNFFFIPFEEIINDPLKWMNKIFSFLEIAHLKQLNFEETSRNQRNIQSKIKFIDINIETKKNSYWTIEDIKQLEKIAEIDFIKFWNLSEWI